MGEVSSEMDFVGVGDPMSSQQWLLLLGDPDINGDHSNNISGGQDPTQPEMCF